MTFEEALALPEGAIVKAVQPCDGVEYTWLRHTADRAEPHDDGDGRVMLKRPEVHPDNQFLYLFAYASKITLG